MEGNITNHNGRSRNPKRRKPDVLTLRMPTGLPRPGRWVALVNGKKEQLWQISAVNRALTGDLIEIVMVPSNWPAQKAP
jgi:hypothetical protein